VRPRQRELRNRQHGNERARRQADAAHHFQLLTPRPAAAGGS
jgi:hypothetical protein